MWANNSATTENGGLDEPNPYLSRAHPSPIVVHHRRTEENNPLAASPFVSTLSNGGSPLVIPGGSPLVIPAPKDTGKSRAEDYSFPVRLHYLLSVLQDDNLGHYASWQPHGRCFVVHNPDEFEREILPMWFRQSRLGSFQRQLNLYGFKRLKTGRDKGGYYHEFFLRGSPNLAHKIKRVGASKAKGGAAKRRGSNDSNDSSDEEPNFYEIPFIPMDVPSPGTSHRDEQAQTTQNAPPSHVTYHGPSMNQVPGVSSGAELAGAPEIHNGRQVTVPPGPHPQQGEVYYVPVPVSYPAGGNIVYYGHPPPPSYHHAHQRPQEVFQYVPEHSTAYSLYTH